MKQEDERANVELRSDLAEAGDKRFEDLGLDSVLIRKRNTLAVSSPPKETSNKRER